ncbi:TonB-dependent siderophore receptor [Nostoc sp.]|uniref:TonB-dependent siderophore receptor n=1 Tax=Nostoc sp. TaxID=1180 RepID=UPI002FF46F72
MYRLNFAAQTTESFLDFYDEQKYFVAPTLSWQIGDRTKLTLQAEYLNRPKKFGQGALPAEGTVLPNPNGKIPSNRNTAEPDNTDSYSTIFIAYDLEHRFSENWQLRNAFGATFNQNDRDFSRVTSLAEDKRTLTREYDSGIEYNESFNLDTYVVGKFATGSIRHQLVTGFNLTRQNNVSNRTFREAASIDLFKPVYGQFFDATSRYGAVTGAFDSTSTTDALGVYIQDQVTLANNLKLLVCGRFDLVELTIAGMVCSLDS